MSDAPPPPEPPEEQPSGTPEPTDRTPWRNAPRPSRTGGSVWLGIVVGVVAFAASILLAIVLSPYLPSALSALVLVLPLGYLGVSAVLAGRPGTARFGAGLFIAVGVAVLLAAGVCTAVVFSGRSIA